MKVRSGISDTEVHGREKNCLSNWESRGREELFE
jgi:hypothetical protein